MACHGDKLLHIGAVTTVNNKDHALHQVIEYEIKFPHSLSTLQSVIEERDCFYMYFKGLILLQKAQKML